MVKSIVCTAEKRKYPHTKKSYSIEPFVKLFASSPAVAVVRKTAKKVLISRWNNNPLNKSTKAAFHTTFLWLNALKTTGSGVPSTRPATLDTKGEDGFKCKDQAASDRVLLLSQVKFSQRAFF